MDQDVFLFYQGFVLVVGRGHRVHLLSLEFEIPNSVYETCRQAMQRSVEAKQAWNRLWNDYRRAHPDLAAKLEKTFAGELPADWEFALPVFRVGDKVATSDASGQIINALASAIPYFFAGSADLASSNKTAIRREETYPGNFLMGKSDLRKSKSWTVSRHGITDNTQVRSAIVCGLVCRAASPSFLGFRYFHPLSRSASRASTRIERSV